ncbi:hypothetical protein D3C84_763950 [compost metagenome]
MHRHTLGVETMIDFPARATRLRDLQHRTAHLKYIADVHVALRKFERRNVLPQAARKQLMGTVRKGLRQVLIIFGRIVMNSLFRTAVNPGVAMLVTDNPVKLDANGA